MKNEVPNNSPLTFIRGIIKYVSCSLKGNKNCSDMNKNNTQIKKQPAVEHVMEDYYSTY